MEVFDSNTDPMNTGVGVGGGIGGGTGSGIGIRGGDVVQRVYQTSPAGQNGLFPICDQEDFNLNFGNRDVAILQITIW